MKRHLSIPFLMLALVGILTIPSASLAAAPTFRVKIDDTEVGVDVCGVTGTVHATGVNIVTLNGDSFTQRGQVKTVFTADDGRMAVLQNAGTITDTFTDNGDGTITFTTIYKGLPERISSRGQGGTALRDAGVITFITTIDLNTGDVTTNVEVHGPHPEADSDFTLFCDAFLAALQ